MVARRDGVAVARGHRRQLRRRGARRWPPISATSRRARRRELRQGRRYAVARRLAGLFASYARQRPQLLVDWENGTAGDLDADLDWQPHLWRALVDRVDADPPHIRHAKTVARCRSHPPTCPSASRCSVTPGCRAPRSNCSTRWPPTTTFTCGCRTPATTCGSRWPACTARSPAATTPATARSGTRCWPPSAATSANCSAACRPIRRPTNTCWIGWRPRSPRHAAGLAAVRHHRQRSATATAGRCAATTVRCRCTAATARPARSTCSARCCSACSPTTPRSNPATSWSCARTSRPTRR